MHLFGEPHIQPQDLAKMKSCLKKPPQSPQCHKRPSLREVIRRASYRRVSTNIHDEQLTMQSETTEHSISDSCSSSRRVSESFRTLFARSQGSSHRIFAGREKEKKSLIKFGDVNIREYEVTAGHHPGGRSGVPIEVSSTFSALLGFCNFNQCMEFISPRMLLSLFLFSSAGNTTNLTHNQSMNTNLTVQFYDPPT